MFIQGVFLVIIVASLVLLGMKFLCRRVQTSKRRLEEISKRLETELQQRAVIEKELAEREKRYRLLTQNMVDLIWATDENLQLTFLSPSVYQFLGYDLSEVDTLKTQDILTEDSFQKALAIFREQKKKAETTPLIEPYTMEVEHVRKDGTTFLAEVRATIVRNEAGRVIGLQASSRDITDRKQIEEELKHSEERYRELVENANSIILRIDREGRITFFNEFAERFFGYKASEILGKNVIGTIVPPVDTEGIDMTSMIKSILQNPQKYEVNENENITKNGERVWIVWTNRVIVNQNGEEEILSVGNDITPIKKLQENLRKLSLAVEQSPSSIVITDVDGNIEYVNPYFEKVTGYTFAEAKGQNPRILKSGRQPPELYEELWKTITSGKIWYGEFCNKKKNGEFYWERAAIAPIWDDRGRITHYVAVKSDVTELHEAFEKLKEMERIINLSRTVVVLWRIEEGWPVDFITVNIRQFGYSAEEFYSDPRLFSRIIYPEDFSSVQKKIEEALEKGKKEFLHEYRIYAKNGELHWVECYYQLRITEDGIPTHLEGVFFDITERKVAMEKIQEAINMKAEFISVVSHELRTPLTAIKESIHLVADGSTGPLNAEQKEFLGIASRNVNRLSTLINDVLDYHRMESGRMEFVFKPTDINQLVKEAVKTMSAVAENKGLQVKMDLDEDIGKIFLDENRILQVLNNLINNAIKFTEKGEITLRTYLSENNVCVAVQDTGIGIKKESIPKLFQTFSQVDEGKNQQGGASGLGLAICKGIIERHGGKIWVESAVGQGSTFAFQIPRRQS